jgi:hypothetical protein
MGERKKRQEGRMGKGNLLSHLKGDGEGKHSKGKKKNFFLS